MDKVSPVSEHGSKSASTRLVVLLGTLLVLTAAVMTLAGCPSATPKAAPESEEEAVEPTLLGTWTGTGTGGYYKDGEHVCSVTNTLTFTKSRWIQHTVGILDDGTVDNQCADSGTWEVGGSMVTRKWVDEDNDQRVDRSVDKEYYFANADIVFIHHWDSGDVETRFSRYVRVEDPLPTLLGIWRASIPQEEDEGTPWIDERTIAINADDLRWTGSGEECRPGARDRNSISIASTLSATGYWRTQLSACTKPTVSRVPVASA